MHSFIVNIVLNGLSPENIIPQKTAINTGQTEFFGNRKLFPRCVRISVILISDALEGAKGLDPHCHLKSLDY